MLRRDGENAATKHGAVIGRFGFIAKNEPTGSTELMQAEGDLDRIYADRAGSDYDIENITTADSRSV